MDIIKQVKQSPGLMEKLRGMDLEPHIHAPILFVKIKLLWLCNLSCTFCQPNRSTAVMGREQVRELLDTLRARGLKKVHFSGGEVFCHPEIIPILEHARGSGLQVNLTTNGTLVTKEIAKRIVKTGIHSVSISLDSHRPETHDRLRGTPGAFKKTVKAIHYLLRYREKQKKKKMTLRVNTVVCRDNVDHLEGLHQLLSGIHPDIIWKLLPVDAYLDKGQRMDKKMAGKFIKRTSRWSLLDDIPLEQMGKNPRKAFSKGKYAGDFYQEHPCYIPWFHLFIDPEGFVYPCCASSAKAPAIGKIPEQPLEEILSGPKRRQLLMDMAAGQVMKVCHSCDDFLEENARLHQLLFPPEVNQMNDNKNVPAGPPLDKGNRPPAPPGTPKPLG